MTAQEFFEMQCRKANWQDEIMAPPTEAQEGLDILIKHFLGEDWYCISTNNSQGSTEAIYEILQKYQQKGIIKRIKRFWRKIHAEEKERN